MFNITNILGYLCNSPAMTVGLLSGMRKGELIPAFDGAADGDINSRFGDNQANNYLCHNGIG